MKGLANNTLKNFLAGNCSEQELDEINVFICESEENARQLFRMEELYHLGKRDTSAADQLIDRAEKRLFKRIEQEEATENRKWVISGWRRYAALIAVVLLAGGGLGYWYSTDNKNIIIETALTDAVKEVTLPDGSKVWLNNGTTLRYPEKLAGKERRVHIEGEAYFEVVKDARKPFIVESDAMQVKVLGTAFNFKNERSSRIAETSLIEGEIEVRGNNEEGMVSLSPGQRAELNKSTGRLTVKQVDTQLDVVWRDNLIPFNAADLYTITRTLERFYNVKIILAPDISSEVTYSGVIKRQNTIESALNSLKHAIPIQYKIAGNNVFISSEEKDERK